MCHVSTTANKRHIPANLTLGILEERWPVTRQSSWRMSCVQDGGKWFTAMKHNGGGWGSICGQGRLKRKDQCLVRGQCVMVWSEGRREAYQAEVQRLLLSHGEFIGGFSGEIGVVSESTVAVAVPVAMVMAWTVARIETWHRYSIDCPYRIIKACSCVRFESSVGDDFCLPW